MRRATPCALRRTYCVPAIERLESRCVLSGNPYTVAAGPDPLMDSHVAATSPANAPAVHQDAATTSQTVTVSAQYVGTAAVWVDQPARPTANGPSSWIVTVPVYVIHIEVNAGHGNSSQSGYESDRFPEGRRTGGMRSDLGALGGSGAYAVPPTDAAANTTTDHRSDSAESTASN